MSEQRVENKKEEKYRGERLVDRTKKMSSFIEECMLFLLLFRSSIIRFIYREPNMIVDFVAEKAINSCNDSVILDAETVWAPLFSILPFYQIIKM